MSYTTGTAAERRVSFLQGPGLLLGLLLLTLFQIGCEGTDYRPAAVGPEGKITVVIDSSNWKGEVGEALRSTLGGYIPTLPSPERAFDLQVVDLSAQTAPEHIRRQKNIVFVAPLSDSTAEAQFMRRRLPQQVLENKQSVYVTKQDLWRRQQMVAYLTAATPDALAEKIRSEEEDLLQAFNTITRQRMTQEMFDRGRQVDIEEKLMEEHNFAVNVQHDYRIAIDTTNFVWLRRILPETWRSLFIYYTDDVGPSELSPEWIQSTRDSLTKRYIQGNVAGYMKIDYRDLTTRDRLAAERVNFLDRYGYEVRGVWAMFTGDSSSVAYVPPGGPFVTYGFYDQSTGRTYLIDGAVFAPNFDKRSFLRQMEVIAYTFRTEEEVDGSSPQSASANQ